MSLSLRKCIAHCIEVKYSIAFLESAGCAEFMRVTGRELHLISAFAMGDASLWQQDFRENLMVCKMCLNFAARLRGVVDHLPWLMIHNIKLTDHFPCQRISGLLHVFLK